MSDTGHAKNLANLSELINFIQGYGFPYNPTNAEIQLTSLENLFANARNAQNEIHTKDAAETTAINIRKNSFEPLSKLITRLSNAFIGCGATEIEMVNFQEIARKIQGKRASNPVIQTDAENTEAPPRTVSALQMGFEDRQENLNRLIEYLAANPKYSVNEDDLKLESLRTLANSLRDMNNAVSIATVAVDNARLTRNQMFYNDETGLVRTVQTAKSYIKSVFGADSSQYKQVSGLKFTNPR